MLNKSSYNGFLIMTERASFPFQKFSQEFISRQHGLIIASTECIFRTRNFMMKPFTGAYENNELKEQKFLIIRLNESKRSVNLYCINIICMSRVYILIIDLMSKLT